MMLKKVITISSFILIATSYDITSSEPTLKIRYLMNEPMSLFDFGMYKLNEHLKSSSEYILDKREGVVIAVYDPDKNRINILGEAYIDDITQARKVCNDTISSIKSTLGVSYKTGEKISASAPDPIGSYFRYARYTIKSEAIDLYSELNNLTEIDIFIPIPKVGRFGGIRCKSPLMSKEVIYSSEE